MASVLSLAIKINADASGLKLDPVERALKQLGVETAKVTSIFDKFTATSEGAARAQAATDKSLTDLTAARKAGTVSAEQFAESFNKIRDAATQQAAAFAEGQRLTEANRTEEERRAITLARLNELFDQGAISQETFNRASAEASGANAAAAELERARVQALAEAESNRTAILNEGVRLAQRFSSEEEKRAISLQRIQELLNQGAISEEIASRARAEASGANAAAARAAADAAQQEAAAFQRGIDITQKYVTEEERRAASIAELDALLKARAISEETYSRAVADASGANAAAAEAEKARVQALAQAESQRKAVLDEGVRLAERFSSEEEKRSASLLRIQELLDQGAISEEIASRARAEASGTNAAAAKAEKERADALAAASRIIEANLTPQERYDAQIQQLQGHLDAGRLSQEQFNRAAAKAQQDLQRVGEAAGKTDQNIESLTKNVRLLSVIEVGRLIVDGIQAISNVVSSVANNIASFASGVANSFDAFNDLSARTGIGVEALQGYSLAAKLAGVDTAEFGAAVQRLSVTIGKATPGDNLDKSLKAINLSVSELRSLSPEQQFSAIGEAISGLPTAADRAAAAVEIFGKQGAALAPLFREGAASIEELRNRADRLGIIVDETQLNNIGSMNDAFDLARATVEGIAGQVIGNLAPAVTAVVDQFLEFIEAFNGTGGTGGNAIADTISRVLLDAADYFAGKFDEFAGYFSSFTVSLDDAGQVFSTVSNILTTIAESFRAVFNLLQVGVGAITEGFGKLLEGIGSFISSDLEEFGRNLAAAASEQNRANIAEMEDAATKAAAAFNNALDGGAGSTTAAGEGAASRFMSGVRSRFETEQSPEFKVESNIDDTADRLARFLSDSNEGASEFLQQSSDTLKVFQQQADAGQLTAGQIQIMNGFMEKLNNELNTELAKRQEIAEAATKQADADAKRVSELTKSSDATAKILEDIAAVERQITAAQAAASAPSVDAAGSSSAADRLAELEQLREKLDSQLESAQLGFADGFEAAFSKVGDDLNELGVKANDFGQAGAEAFRLLQEGVQAAKDQVGDGILNREAFEQQVEQQKRVFAQEIENIKAAANERQRVNEFVDKALLEMQFGNDAARGEAGQRAIEIEQEIIRVQEEVQQARKIGDNEALQAGIARIAQLDQVFTKEQDIASGRAKFEEEQRKKQEETQKQQQQEAQKAQEAQQKAQEERAKQQKAEFDRQAKITRQLNSVGQQSVSGSDIRSTEGASSFIRAAAGQFDPVLAQLRVQTKLLNTIAIGIAQNLSQLTGTPAQIGAVRV